MIAKGVMNQAYHGAAVKFKGLKERGAGQKPPAERGAVGTPSSISATSLDLDEASSKASSKALSKASSKAQSAKDHAALFFQPKHSNPVKASLDMDYIVTAFILEGGLPFSTVNNPNLARMITHARTLPANYVPPNRQKISCPYMDIMYDQRLRANEEKLNQHSEIFGLGLYCDGATIKKMPFYNFLACGAYIPHAVLEIKDCTEQMATGGRKTATFLAEVMAKHINKLDPYQTSADSVYFDGASNVQKAGRLLELP
jgi:hypothetical protein